MRNSTAGNKTVDLERLSRSVGRIANSLFAIGSIFDYGDANMPGGKSFACWPSPAFWFRIRGISFLP
jgi:hypothetical protein